MSVSAFQDLPLADRDREWDGDAAEKRVRKWADAEDEPNQKYRDAHVWYDSDKKDNFTSYKLLIADVVDGKLEAVPRGVMAAGAIMDGARGGVDLPKTTSIGSRATSPSTTRKWVTQRPGSVTDSARLRAWTPVARVGSPPARQPTCTSATYELPCWRGCSPVRRADAF